MHSGNEPFRTRPGSLSPGSPGLRAIGLLDWLHFYFRELVEDNGGAIGGSDTNTYIVAFVLQLFDGAFTRSYDIHQNVSWLEVYYSFRHRCSPFGVWTTTSCRQHTCGCCCAT